MVKLGDSKETNSKKTETVETKTSSLLFILAIAAGTHKLYISTFCAHFCLQRPLGLDKSACRATKDIKPLFS